MPTAGQHKQELQDELLSIWSTGRFTDRNECQGEICKSFLTVNMIQKSSFLDEVPLKNKSRGKGQIPQKQCFHCFSPHLHITKTTLVAFWLEGIGMAGGCIQYKKRVLPLFDTCHCSSQGL